ncbi:MAG: amidohydrolase family protein [Acidimicrobiales bacterium]
MTELDRFDWLSKRVETAIDLKQRIIDPHHHLWNRGGSTYLAPELLADLTTSHNVVRSVFVECKANYDRSVDRHMAPVGETIFAAGEADAIEAAGGPKLAGIVAHADMMLGDAVEEVLAAHDAASGGRFRGIRHVASWDASGDIENGHSRPFEAMMRTDEFQRGVRKLAAMNFSFDAWLYHPQLPDLAALADAVPEATIILNHLGAPLAVGPYGRDPQATRLAWRASMKDVASRPNVMLKVGGIGMDDYFAMGWASLDAPPSSEQVADYWSSDVGWAIDTFGPGRCMFESNFPVDRQSLPYPVLWNAFQIMAAKYNAGERDRLFAGTAEEVYRLV